MAVRPWRVRLGMKVIYTNITAGDPIHQTNASGAPLVVTTVYVITDRNNHPRGSEIYLRGFAVPFHSTQFEEQF